MFQWLENGSGQPTVGDLLLPISFTNKIFYASHVYNRIGSTGTVPHVQIISLSKINIVSDMFSKIWSIESHLMLILGY